MLGSVISSGDVQARWAYAEISSSRFGWCFKEALLAFPELLQKARRHAPFDDLAPDEKRRLRDAHAYCREFSLWFFNRPPNDGLYRCEAWSKADMARLWTIAVFGSKPFMEFLADIPDASDESDPRNISPEFISEDDYIQHEPGVVCLIDGGCMLIEGYRRSVLFMKFAASDAQFLLWVPTGPIEASFIERR